MSSDFVSFLPPLGKDIDGYTRTKPPSEQHSAVHHTFRDAMFVREEVFVKEQHVPLDRELDEDDRHSFHWIVYASVSSSGSKNTEPVVQRGIGPSSKQAQAPGEHKPSPHDRSRSNSDSIGSNLPVGVIRLVPPPDALCRKQSSHKLSHEAGSSSQTAQSADSTAAHDPHPTVFPGERYVKLGRLATLKAYRGLGLSRLLVNAALQYARNNPDEFGQQRTEGVALEEARLQGRHVNDTWKGLVYVHAQKDRTIGLWKRYGFEIDEGMGVWDEEGMDHVGMWKRVEVNQDRRRSRGLSLSNE